MDSKALIGAIATTIVILSYAPYFRDILANKTRPHAISWLIWGVLTGIGFAGQVAGDAGPGAWATGFTAVVCLVVCGFGVAKGRTTIVWLDWFSLVGAGVALGLWGITRDPLLSVIISIAIYAMGYLPTFRKSWHLPYQETLSTYFLAGLTSFVSLFALTQFNLLTALYPISLMIMNWAFSATLVSRRQHMQHAALAESAHGVD